MVWYSFLLTVRVSVFRPPLLLLLLRKKTCATKMTRGSILRLSVARSSPGCACALSYIFEFRKRCEKKGAARRAVHKEQSQEGCYNTKQEMDFVLRSSEANESGKSEEKRLFLRPDATKKSVFWLDLPQEQAPEEKNGNEEKNSNNIPKKLKNMTPDERVQAMIDLGMI